MEHPVELRGPWPQAAFVRVSSSFSGVFKGDNLVFSGYKISIRVNSGFSGV